MSSSMDMNVRRLSPVRLYIYGLICRILPETSFFSLKRQLLRWCGVSIGDKVCICSSARILGAGCLHIGAESWIGQGVLIMATGEMTIGARCDIGPLVYLGNGTHALNFNRDRCAGEGTSLPIKIGDGCWLGARATILPGVTLGEMTMVAAGAIVTKCYPRRCLLAGVPARIVKDN